MRIIHVIAPAQIGGLERVVQTLAQGQHQSGSAVVVAALLQSGVPEPPLLGELRRAGVAVDVFTSRARAYRSQIGFLTKVAKAHHADILHTHGYLADVLGVFVSRPRSMAHVTTVHGYTGGDWKNRLYERVQRRAFRRFAAVVAVSRKLSDELAANGIAPERIHVLRNGIDVDSPRESRVAARRALGVADDVFAIGWVGRMSQEKGLDVLIDALPALGDLAYQLVPIGTGGQREALEQHGVRLGIGNRITWPGLITDAGALLPAFDVLVISSRTEGTPMVLLEAMAAQVPIVTTAVGGIPDVVAEREALLTPSEQPSALAAAIRQVWENPEQSAHRAMAARRRVESTFAVAPWVQAYETIYRQARAISRQT